MEVGGVLSIKGGEMRRIDWGAGGVCEVEVEVEDQEGKVHQNRRRSGESEHRGAFGILSSAGLGLDEAASGLLLRSMRTDLSLHAVQCALNQRERFDNNDNNSSRDDNKNQAGGRNFFLFFLAWLKQTSEGCIHTRKIIKNKKNYIKSQEKNKIRGRFQIEEIQSSWEFILFYFFSSACVCGGPPGPVRPPPPPPPPPPGGSSSGSQSAPRHPGAGWKSAQQRGLVCVCGG